MKLGILDWGIGGMTFFVGFKARFPGVPVVYLSDAGSMPYGLQSARDLVLRLEAVARRFADIGIDRLVVACNAMSTVLPHHTAGELGLERVGGVVDPAVQAVLESGAAVVGVVGGLRTIRSGVYRRPLAAAGVTVRQRVAQPLSALVEAGLVESRLFRAEVSRVMRPMAHVDALILGCTHYSAGITCFRESTSAALIVDPAREALDRVVTGWFDGGPGPGSGSEAGSGASAAPTADVFFTTGDAVAMARAAHTAFGVALSSVVSVALDLSDLT